MFFSSDSLVISVYDSRSALPVQLTDHNKQISQFTDLSPRWLTKISPANDYDVVAAATSTTIYLS